MNTDEISLQPGALLNMIRDLQLRVTFLERQHRMLCNAIDTDPRDAPEVCRDVRCLNGPAPHLAEQPFGCPRLS